MENEELEGVLNLGSYNVYCPEGSGAKVFNIQELRNSIDSYANSRIQEFVRDVEGMEGEIDDDLYGYDAYPHSDKQAKAVIKKIVALSQKYISKEDNK